MKLKNKLLPLVGIAALSSAIAPLSIITSCSKNNQVTEMVDITNGYSYHAGTYAGKEALNQRTATEAFIAAVKENPNVFKNSVTIHITKKYSTPLILYLNLNKKN